jgi:hypothetical protein
MRFRTASRVRDMIQRPDFVQTVMWCGLLYFTYTQRRNYLSTTVMDKPHLTKRFRNEDILRTESENSQSKINRQWRQENSQIRFRLYENVVLLNLGLISIWRWIFGFNKTASNVHKKFGRQDLVIWPEIKLYSGRRNCEFSVWNGCNTNVFAGTDMKSVSYEIP